MKEETVSFLTIVETTADHIERIHSLIETLCEIARFDYDCIRFDVFQDSYANEKFYALEIWRNQKDLDDYMNSADFHSVMAEIDKLLVNPIHIIMLNRLSKA